MFICYFLRLRSCKYYFHGYDKSSINKKLNIVKNIDWIKSFRIFLPIGNVVWANVLAAFTWCIFDSLSMSVELHFEFLHADSFSMHQIVVAFFCNEINFKNTESSFMPRDFYYCYLPSFKFRPFQSIILLLSAYFQFIKDILWNNFDRHLATSYKSNHDNNVVANTTIAYPRLFKSTLIIGLIDL